MSDPERLDAGQYAVAWFEHDLWLHFGLVPSCVLCRGTADCRPSEFNSRMIRHAVDCPVAVYRRKKAEDAAKPPR